MRKPDIDQATLLRTRSVYLVGEITKLSATKVIAQILFLRADDPSAPIVLHIASEGGILVEGLAIFDVVVQARELVHTECEPLAWGVAALVLASGARGRRRVDRLSEVSLGPLKSVGATSAPATDVALERLETEFVTLLARFTGQLPEAVRADVRAGRSFDAQEAIAYGFADLIL